MKGDITLEETIKNVIEICLDRKKIRGTIKEGCILDDTVILWSMNTEGDNEINDEYNMIKELENFSLPVVKIHKVYVQVKKRMCIALIEEFLKGELYKPHDKHFKMHVNDSLKEQIINIHNILQKNNILIEDLQWIYSETRLTIIDPFKVYKLDDTTKTYVVLGSIQDKRRKSYNRLKANYNLQLNNLLNLCL